MSATTSTVDMLVGPINKEVHDRIMKKRAKDIEFLGEPVMSAILHGPMRELEDLQDIPVNIFASRATVQAQWLIPTLIQKCDDAEPPYNRRKFHVILVDFLKAIEREVKVKKNEQLKEKAALEAKEAKKAAAKPAAQKKTSDTTKKKSAVVQKKSKTASTTTTSSKPAAAQPVARKKGLTTASIVQKVTAAPPAAVETAKKATVVRKEAAAPAATASSHQPSSSSHAERQRSIPNAPQEPPAYTRKSSVVVADRKKPGAEPSIPHAAKKPHHQEHHPQSRHASSTNGTHAKEPNGQQRLSTHNKHGKQDATQPAATAPSKPAAEHAVKGRSRAVLEKAHRNHSHASSAPTMADKLKAFYEKHVSKASKVQRRVETIDVKPDRGKATISGAVGERVDRRHVRFPQEGVDAAVAYSMWKRLAKWDPFWVPNGRLHITKTCPVPAPKEESKTALCSIVTLFSDLTMDGSSIFNVIPFSDWGKVRAASESLEDGESAVLLRMLPLKPHPGKRADCHLWPKGTFLQLDSTPIQLRQRKQQSHDLSEWKAICGHLNVTEHIRDPRKELKIEMACFDDEIYLFCLAICKFRSVDSLFSTLTTPGNRESLSVVDRKAGMERALSHMKSNMVCIDSDDDNENGTKEQTVGKVPFSLVCPISKQLIETPVRGKSCPHWQCFDLKSYLISNQFPSGSRWRCSICDKFVAISDLEICELTKEVIQEFRDEASSDRHRVEIDSDQSYRLLRPHKQRYPKKRPASDTGSNNGGKKGRTDPQEIIIL